MHKCRYVRNMQNWINALLPNQSVQQTIQTEKPFGEKRTIYIVVDCTCLWPASHVHGQKYVLTEMQTMSINTEKCADQKQCMLIYRLVSGRWRNAQCSPEMFLWTCRCPALTLFKMAVWGLSWRLRVRGCCQFHFENSCSLRRRTFVHL